MRSVETAAKTMEEAVTQGLEQLGASLGDVTIDILDEGSKGLFGLIGTKLVRVRLTMKEAEEESPLTALSEERPVKEAPAAAKAAPEAAKEAPEAPKPKKPRKPAKAKGESKPEAPVAAKPAAEKPTAERSTSERSTAERPVAQAGEAPVTPAPLCDPETPEGKAQEFLLNVTQLMNTPVSVAARRDDEGNVRVDMHGDTSGVLIGRRGETLDALQYLTSLNVNKGRDEYVRVTLDTENYRAKREEALTRLANRMANRAVKTGRKVILEPMNPYERRILHSALQQNDAVTTHSEGEEPNRHVVITLKAEEK